MKKLLLLPFLAILFSCVKQETNKTSAEQLLERMRKIQEKGYMCGHHDDPFYGLQWEWDADRSDILETVGDYPAIMSFDLGGIEMGDEKNLDSVPFARIREELVKHHLKGGIVTISWHPRNPVTGGNAWDTSDSLVVRKILSEEPHKSKFKTWITRVGDFLKTLKTEDGTPVPIIFRPWHEGNGSWFWWGYNWCSDEEFLGLWNTLQDYLNEEGLDNLLWSYSTNLDGSWTEERYMKRYPGNDRIGLIGEDSYQWGTEEDFIKQLTADMEFLQEFSAKNNKTFALTECGYKNIPDSTWWTRVLKPIMDQYPINYFLMWRNYKEEYFGPDPDQQSADDFKKLYEAENTLFLQDLR